MRLSCPNCDARYEVDDRIIPKEGRDVQCSSCGKTWFQKSAEQLKAEGTPIVQPRRRKEQQRPEPAPADHDDTPDDSAAPEQVETDGPAPEQEPEEPRPAPVAEPAPQMKKPSKDALDILRQEAAREAEVRKQETRESIETQTDLGLDQAEPAEEPARDVVKQRTARIRGIQGPVDKNITPGDMLPDVEEINSSLRAETAEDHSDEEQQLLDHKKRRSGFRSGFVLAIILALLAVMAYAYAPRIIEQLPGSAPYLNGYVEWVNDLRMWLDGLIRAATEWMSDQG